MRYAFPHMKTASAVLMMSLVACWHADARFFEEWDYDLPDTGIIPNYAHASYASRMRERHGGRSHLGMQRYALTLPLSDPRRSGGAGWRFNAQFDAKATLLDVGGSLDLHRDELFSFSLPLSVMKPLPGGRRLSVALAPGMASDMSGSARGYDLAAFVDYRVKAGETLSYGAGLGMSPRFAQYWVVPFFSLAWQPAPDWEVRLRGYRLTALYALSPQLAVGPFMEGIGGAWMVKTDRGDRIFRVRSLVAGVTGEYGFSRAGQRKRVVTASLGTTLASSAQFCERGGSKDAYETHHYRPGLYAAIGLDFRF